MAQHDYVLANQAGAAFRADVNDVLSAIVSLNSGAAAPGTTFPYMLWMDTTTGILKWRNAADTAWLTFGAASGTRQIFDQDSPPTGWTRDVAINDKVIRIVSGARADGGSWTVGGLDVTGATDAYTLLVADMPAHDHDVTDPGHVHGGVVRAGSFWDLSPGEPNDSVTGNTASAVTGISIASKGGGVGHAHGLGAAGVSSDGTWRPVHRDMILAEKD